MFTSSRLRAGACAAVLLFALGLTTVFGGETVQFPKDDPGLTIELPTGWKADWVDSKTAQGGAGMGGTRLQLSSATGDDLSIKEIPDEAKVTDDASAKAAVTKLALQDLKDFEAASCGPVEEAKVASHTAFGTQVTTGLGKVFYAIFTPDGESYYAMYSMNGGADSVVAAIKAAE